MVDILEHRSVIVDRVTHSFSCTVTRDSRASATTLFDIVSDGSRWSEWAHPLIRYSAWETRGPQDDGGVGAIRAVGARQRPTREMTTVHEPGKRHGYTLLGGGVIRDYNAEVSFEEQPNGTRIEWTGRYNSSSYVAGVAYRLMLRSLFGTFTKNLAKTAERREG